MSTHSQSILIVGGGIMGLLTAHAIKRCNPDTLITICDQDGFPATNSASWMAGGMLAPYSEVEHMPKAFFKAGLAGIEFWKETSLIDANAIGFKQNGSLLTAHKEDRYILDRFKTHLDTHEISYQTLDKQELQKHEPNLAGRFEYGLLIQEEAQLNPQTAMEILTTTLPPHVIEKSNLDHHELFDWIIDCRGSHALDDDPDLRGVKGEMALIRNPEFKLNRPVRLMHPRYPLYIVPRENDVFMIGATSIEAADTTITLRSVMELMSALYSLHPSFGEAEIIDIKAGIRPAYSDNMPKIKIDTLRNKISCNGLFRHGFLLAPVMAECVADYIAVRDNDFMDLFIGRESANETDHQRSGKKLHRAA